MLDRKKEKEKASSSFAILWDLYFADDFTFSYQNLVCAILTMAKEVYV